MVLKKKPKPIITKKATITKKIVPKVPILKERKVEGKPVELVIDKRTLPNPKNTRRTKSLKYARNLPSHCNECPYRSTDVGGNGVCEKYEADSVCVIRKDIAKAVDVFNERNEGKILAMMESEFTDNFEKLVFFQTMESAGNELNPEVTKRISAMTNLGKVISEIKTKKETIQIKETRISKGKIEEIGQMISVTSESSPDV